MPRRAAHERARVIRKAGYFATTPGFQAPTYMARPADVAPPLAGELDETGGGFIGSTGEEAGRARQLQEQQLAAARQFTGEEAPAPGEEPSAEAAGEGPEEEEEEIEETEEEPSDGYDPAELIRLQAAVRRARTEAVEEERAEERRTASKEDERKNASRAIRMFLNEIIGAGGAAETFGLTFIVSVIIMNLQMFGHFFLTHKKDSSSLGDIFFDQTFPETFETLIKTLCCCFALPIMPPCYIVTAVILMIVVLQKLYPLLFKALHFLSFF